MTSPFAKLVIASSLAALVAVAFAADEKKSEQKKKAPNATAGMLKKLEGAALPADVLEKAKKVLDEHGPKLAEAQAKVNAILSDEQKKVRQEAMKAAQTAGKKGKEAQDEVNAAIKLTDEQKKGYEEAQKAAQAVQAEMNKALAALLTDEQKEKLGFGGKKKAAK